ncbi:MAG: tetratricopeptide repeat protein [Myxococcales bacterium]|nr:tetratricopeptide repeat protein [Myxococcales bacterium]
MSAPDRAETTAALAADGDRTLARLEPALAAAEAHIRQWTPVAVADAAVADFRRALVAQGAFGLGGGDPQRIEDALFAEVPDSPLAEGTLRDAWLVLCDELARTGDKPPFGGSGGAERWAFTARSRAWPHVDPAGDVARVADLFDGPARLVVVRGPGTSSFLAAVRRVLLGRHGADVFVPPVVPAARDDLVGLLRPYVERAEIDPKLREAFDKLGYGEDWVGLLGRVGDSAPVALLLDDGHVQSRAVLLGLPLFVEPAPDRKALLVMAAPDDPNDDGPLAEVIADARERELLVEITLPDFSVEHVSALCDAWFHGKAPAWADVLVEAVPAVRAPLQLACARAWLAALTDAEGRPDPAGREHLTAGFDVDALLPTHVGARRALAIAALEGDSFHAFALGRALGRDEDFVEDLLHDDELEFDGEVVGGCDAAVPTGRTIWADLPDGLHPVFRFADARVPAALQARLADEERLKAARTLRDALLQGYGPAGAWQVADRLWNLDLIAGRDRQVQQLMLGTNVPQRVEAGFRRMVPVLQAKSPYRLALARLYGAGMEMGSVASVTGRVQLADQGFQAAAAAAQRLGRPGPAGEALAKLAEVRLALALPKPAEQALDVAEKLLQQADHGRSLARIALLRAEASILDGEVQPALTLLKQGVDALRSLGDAGHTALGLVRLGRVRYELGDREAGIAALDEAIRAADASGDPRPAAAARMARAFVHAEQDQLDAAFALLNQAAQAFQRARMPVHIVEVAAAGLQRRHGNPGEAEKRLRAMADAFKKGGAAIQWADAWQEVGRCLLDQEKYTDAAEVLAEALDVRRRARDRFSLVRLWTDLGSAREGQGDRGGALSALGLARRMAERMEMARWLGALDAQLARIAADADRDPSVDAEALRTRAAAEVDEMEAIWKAPPQPADAGGKQVH